MKIAVAQMNCLPGDIASNCSKIPVFAERAKEQSCELIVFPEMMDTGYEMRAVQKDASPWTEIPYMTAKRASADFEMWLICGLSEREEKKIYNSIAVFDPAGALAGKYRKTHLFSLDPINEDRYLTAGNSLVVVQIKDMKWGFMICHDLRFPEVARYLIKKGAEVLVVCSAWPFPRDSHWKALTTARAIENRSYVVGANRVGSDGALTFCGSSCIIDPYGDLVARSSADREELLIGEIAPEAVNSLRDSMPCSQRLERRIV